MYTHLPSKTLILLLLFMVVSSPMMVLGQTGDDFISVDFDPDTPIIEHWEDPLMDAGAVIYHDEQFHMFTNSTAHLVSLPTSTILRQRMVLSGYDNRRIRYFQALMCHLMCRWRWCQAF